MNQQNEPITSKLLSLAIAPLLLLVSACGGAGSSPSLPQNGSATSGSLSNSQTLSDAQSFALERSVSPQNQSANGLLYVGNAGNSSVTVYKQNAQGNSSPIRVIAGSRTKINFSRNYGSQLSEDADGNLYIANGTSVIVFAPGANGNVAPIRDLTGPRTGIQSATAATVDQKTGKLFVFNEQSGNGASNVLRFPLKATGNMAPSAASQTEFGVAAQIASDSTGQNIIEATNGFCCNSSRSGFVTIPKQFANNANINSLYSIDYFGPSGVTDDAATKTYLTTAYDGIYRFAEVTVGHGQVPGAGPSFTPAVVSIISSDTCGRQLSLGSLRDIYVVHGTQSGCATDAVFVYKHDAAGNVPPLRVLSGPATMLDQPISIYAGK